MHYYKDYPSSRTWRVCFYCSVGGDKEIKQFHDEWKAAVYTSFLNGGNPPLTEEVLKELFPKMNI